jgi:hypothetical protein
MKRTWFALSSFLVILILSDIVNAQLINYGRKNTFLRPTNSEETEESIPSWAKELPQPQNTEERRYDTNRDGQLQSAEVKVYLRDIIVRVEARGYISVTTDLLREYDKNKDGAINKNEIELMKEHVK